MGKKGTIAIDGPAASGKTTIGHKLALRLGYLFLDTGCMYRAVTWAALQQGIDLTDEERVTGVAERLDMQIETADGSDGDLYTVKIEQQDVTAALRTPQIDANVSTVSAYGGVRSAMVARQRLLAEKGEVVMVGRDIGTVVLPNAPLKIYMVASVTERAERRLKDRIAQGRPASLDAIVADLERRDEIDSGRKNSPLRPAEDAIIIDTSAKSPTAVLDQILHYVEVIGSVA